MPDLYHTLINHDIGHLRIIADQWGLELDSKVIDPAADELSASLLDPESVRDTIEVLSAEARNALSALVESSGKLEWAAFTRKYGDIREIGAAKRDRERPFLKPGSVAEALFYRGLMDKAFFDGDNGAQEFAYIPEDLFGVIKSVLKLGKKDERGKSLAEPLGRPATPVERAFEIPASDRVLDDATTLLAALRMGMSDFQSDARSHALLTAAKLIKKDTPQAEAAKNFLGAPRPVALNILYKAWLDSQTFNELHLLPNIACDGEWKNDPRATRQFLLGLINDLPKEKWWSIPAFVRAVKEKKPDFQRPAGDYDSWYIKRLVDGQYLRGFAYWDEIDGALIKYFISTLHLLGQADLAAPEAGKEVTAFRIRSSAQTKEEKGKLAISSNGKITTPRLFSRAIRYQIARFCEWDSGDGGRVAAERHIETTEEYKYHVSARSLKRAHEQGLKAEQLLSLLVKHTSGSVPPALVKALKRWDAQGSEAHMETHVILKLSKPEMLDELRKSKAARFLGEVLSPTTVIVKSGAQDKVLAALAELGLFAEELM